MKKSQLKNLFKTENVQELAWEGKCHDCGKEIEIIAQIQEDGEPVIDHGAVYFLNDLYFIKCQECFDLESTLRNYQDCEVYSRVVGYLRPVKQFNPAKQEEFYERTNFAAEKF